MMVLLFSAIFMMNGKPVPANNHYVPPITYQTNRFEARLPSLDSIMAGYGFLGLTYGIYMHELGFSFLYPMLLAITVYAGSAEFLLGNMLLGSFHPLQTFLMVLMVNARHLFYGLSMLDRYKGLGWKKFFLIFGADSFIIPSMVIILLFLTIMRKRLEHV